MKYGQSGLEYLLLIGGVLIVATIIGSYLITAASNIYDKYTQAEKTLYVNAVPKRVAYWEDANTLGSVPFLSVSTGTLTVNGKVSAQEVCIAGVCKTSWPSGGSSSSVWKVNGSDIYYTGGRVGIGTSTPAYDLDVNGAVNAKEVCIGGTCIKDWSEVNGGGKTAPATLPIIFASTVSPQEKIGTGLCAIYSGTKYCELKASLCMALCGESGLSSNCIDGKSSTGTKYSCNNVLWQVYSEQIEEAPSGDSDGDGVKEIASNGRITFLFADAPDARGWTYSSTIYDSKNPSYQAKGTVKIGSNGVEYYNDTSGIEYDSVDGVLERNIWIGVPTNVEICVEHGYGTHTDDCAFRLYVDGKSITGYSSVACYKRTECATMNLNAGNHTIKVEIVGEDSGGYYNVMMAYIRSVSISGLKDRIIYSRIKNEMYEIR